MLVRNLEVHQFAGPWTSLRTSLRTHKGGRWLERTHFTSSCSFPFFAFFVRLWNDALRICFLHFIRGGRFGPPDSQRDKLLRRSFEGGRLDMLIPDD